MKPLNDLAKIKLDGDKYGFSTEKDTSESGILVELPDKFDYFGFWSFAFEDSFMNEEKLSKLYDRWAEKIGKRVYWTAMSERGNILKKGDEEFAFVKLSSLIAVDDDLESAAVNLHSDGSGAYKA